MDCIHCLNKPWDRTMSLRSSTWKLETEPFIVTMACWSQLFNGFLCEVLSAHDNLVSDFLENASDRLLSDMLEIYFGDQFKSKRQTDRCGWCEYLCSSIWVFFQPVWRDLFAVCSLHYCIVFYLLWAFTIKLNEKKTCPVHINLPRITSFWE